MAIHSPMRTRMRSILVTVAIVTVAGLFGCNIDSGTDSLNQSLGEEAADTTRVTFAAVQWTAYDADGTVETGLEIQWRINFTSTTNRQLLIKRYWLDDDEGTTIVDRAPVNAITNSGKPASGKERWIPVARETSAGTYRFRMRYETGRLLRDHNDQTRWVGPFSVGTLDTTFAVTPINP